MSPAAAKAGDVAAATPATGAAAGSRNIRLQYLRAAAATAVVLYHASHYLNDLRGDGRLLDVFGGAWGAYGVAIFFALSGYLMAELIARDDPGRFLLSRVARIYPAMLLLTAAFALLFLLSGQPRGVTVLSLSLAPAGPRGYLLGVEWTLLYEMTYYVALALLAFAGLSRLLVVVMLGWLVLLAASWFAGPGRTDILQPVLSELPLAMVNLPFVLGFLAAGARSRGWLPPGLAILACVAALPIAVAPDGAMRLFAGLSASLLVAAIIRSPAPPPAPHWPARLGARMGDASYVLYLAHVPVFLLLDKALPQQTPTALVWFAFIVGAFGLSLLLGPLDLALHRGLKRRIDAAPERRVRIAGVAIIAGFLATAIHAEREVRADHEEEAQARRILAAPPVAAGPGVRAEIDLVSRLGDQRWVVRGYGIDLDRPNLASHIAIRQNGDLLAIDRMRRMRVATARELGRADLESRRFGFAIILPAGFSCANGPLEAVLIFEDGRTQSLAPGPLATICG